MAENFRDHTTQLLSSQKYKEAAEWLKQSGVHKFINSAEDHGWSVLHNVCALGQKELVSICLDQGANVNHTDISGFTALHEAVRYSQFKCVKELCENGADVTLKTNSGETAYNIALELHLNEVCHYLKDKERDAKPKQHQVDQNRDGLAKIQKDLLCIQNLIKKQQSVNEAENKKLRNSLMESDATIKQLQARIEHLEELSEQYANCSESGKANHLYSKIKHNLVYIIANIQAEEHLDHLVQEEALNLVEHQSIYNKTTDYAKAQELIYTLLRKPDHSWTLIFLESMKNHHATHIAQLLTA